jgi:hypothetical protein
MIGLLVAWVLSEFWGPYVIGAAAYGRLEAQGVIEWGTGGFTALILGVAFWPEIKRYLLGGAARERRILATGRPAAATVISLDENSGGGVVTVNDQPYLNLVLEVNDGVGPPFAVSMDLVIPRTALPRFQPGAVIPVKIDPGNPRRVVIDWDT